jgi:small subunit ribosomal protein S19e
MGVYDVPSKYLVEEVADKLKSEIQEPEFVLYAKTGVHKERAPQRDDWFYVRMGSILYRAYKWNVIGTERLRSYYGGRKRRGVKTEHTHKASGKVIRTAVQLLEGAGYLEKAKPKGRKLSPKGQKLLNEISKITAKNVEEDKYKKVVKKKVVDQKALEAKKELARYAKEKKERGAKK